MKVLTFVVVGAGPTGVELAGALAEVSRHTLRDQFRQIDPAAARVILLEGADRILLGFSETLAQHAVQGLQGLGVEVRVGCQVEEIGAGVIGMRSRGESEELSCGVVLWAAGVRASALGGDLVVGSEIEFGAGGHAARALCCAAHPAAPGRPDL